MTSTGTADGFRRRPVAAAAVIQSLYRRNLAVTIKADHSPVTEADVRAEEAIRTMLRARFPDHGFYGEESGRAAHGCRERLAGRSARWHQVLRARLPVLLHADRAAARRASWCSGCRAHRRTARSPGPSAVRGHSSTVKPIRVSAIDALGRSDPIRPATSNRWPARRAGWSRFGALIGRVSRVRGYGDFVHYHLLARGALDVVIESDVNILDIAALTVIVREAGGVFTDLAGRRVGSRPPACWPPTACCTRRAAHDAAGPWPA